MTNFEEIKGYSIKEMAEFIYYADSSSDHWPFPCRFCKRDYDDSCIYHSGDVPKEYCVQGVIEWLNSESESEAE